MTVFGDRLGLPFDDVFYFGNAVAEAGNSATSAQVTTTDLLLARNNPRNFLNAAAVDYAYDFNRDRHVNSTDVVLARNNQTNFTNWLKLIDLSSGHSASQAGQSPTPATVPESLSRPAPESDSVEELAWFYQYERPAARNAHDEKDDAARTAVEKVMATYWP